MSERESEREKEDARKEEINQHLTKSIDTSLFYSNHFLCRLWLKLNCNSK